MTLRLIIATLAIAAMTPAFAGEIACPDLSTSVQVAPCPSEEELRYTFNGFCGDNARMFAKDTDTCVSYENYRKVKNNALWEAGSSEFQGYVSCDLDPSSVKAAKVQSIAVGKAGKLTRVVCEYGNGVVFAFRTHAACKIQGEGACAGASCKASCD
jgi:hypothetical protein